MADKLNVLFLCTANSCRSQMAEAFVDYRLVRDDIRIFIETLSDVLSGNR